MTAMNRITADDLRRAVRMIVAVYEADDDVLDRVTREVAAADRWMPHSLACAVVARTTLLAIDEDERDEGALTMWLHSAVEATLGDGDAWWVRGTDDG